MVKKLFAERPELYHHITVISFMPHVLYKVSQLYYLLFHLSFPSLYYRFSFVFPSLFVQLRKDDPKIAVGLVKRTNVLSTRPNGARRNKELWKHLLAVPLDRLLTWSMETWIWRILGASLLLAHKDDILKKKYDVHGVIVIFTSSPPPSQLFPRMGGGGGGGGGWIFFLEMSQRLWIASSPFTEKLTGDEIYTSHYETCKSHPQSAFQCCSAFFKAGNGSGDEAACGYDCLCCWRWPQASSTYPRSPAPHRLNFKRWEERGYCVVAWTVNNKEEKEHFQNNLNLPFLTDAVSPDSTAPEQGGH